MTLIIVSTNTDAPFEYFIFASFKNRACCRASNVRVFWPLSAANFVLDEADDLNASPMTVWTQVPFPYQTNATDVAVTWPLAAGNKFYRLRKP